MPFQSLARAQRKVFSGRRERVELVSGTAGGTAPVAPASDPGRAQAAIFHESQDFSWEALRDRVEVTVRRQTEAVNTAAAPQGVGETETQAKRWESHFVRHVEAATPFFKERRGLLLMFPQLLGGGGGGGGGCGGGCCGGGAEKGKENRRGARGKLGRAQAIVKQAGLASRVLGSSV